VSLARPENESNPTDDGITRSYLWTPRTKTLTGRYRRRAQNDQTGRVRSICVAKGQRGSGRPQRDDVTNKTRFHDSFKQTYTNNYVFLESQMWFDCGVGRDFSECKSAPTDKQIGHRIVHVPSIRWLIVTIPREMLTNPSTAAWRQFSNHRNTPRVIISDFVTLSAFLYCRAAARP